MHTRYADIPVYATKDGSEIRELMHPATHGNASQSLVEAVVAPGATTRLHCRGHSEELYHITRGQGEMRLSEERFPVQFGYTVRIPPGTPHNIRNTGTEPLHILCSCAPPYVHDDTELLDCNAG